MSAPTHRLRDAQHISYGFLAVRSAEALKALQTNQTLSEEEEEVLRSAIDFFAEIQNGAGLVETGTYQGGNAIASMDALGFAMGPLEQLQGDVKDEEVSDIVCRMQGTLKKAVETPNELTQDDWDILSTAKHFFEFINQALLERVSKDRLSQGRRGRRLRNFPALQ